MNKMKLLSYRYIYKIDFLKSYLILSHLTRVGYLFGLTSLMVWVILAVIPLDIRFHHMQRCIQADQHPRYYQLHLTRESSLHIASNMSIGVLYTLTCTTETWWYMYGWPTVSKLQTTLTPRVKWFGGSSPPLIFSISHPNILTSFFWQK